MGEASVEKLNGYSLMLRRDEADVVVYLRKSWLIVEFVVVYIPAVDNSMISTHCVQRLDAKYGQIILFEMMASRAIVYLRIIVVFNLESWLTS